MPMLDASWSPQIRKIGDLERQDHWHLTPDHECYFFGEYTARAGYAHSSTNQIIGNLKKKPSVRNTPQWRYKVQDMRRVAAAICGALNPQAFATTLFVPIPPLKMRTDPEYDSRIADIARMIGQDIQVRELIDTVVAREPLHESDQRLTPTQLTATLAVNEALCDPAPANIILLDDVITTGCSFVACNSLLAARYPGVPILGIFAARRAVDRNDAFAEWGDPDDL